MSAMSQSYHIKTEIVPVSKMTSSTTKMGLQALAEVAIGRLLEEQDEASAASTKVRIFSFLTGFSFFNIFFRFLRSSTAPTR